MHNNSIPTTFFPVGLRQWRESFDYWRGSKFRWTGPHLRHTQSGHGQSLDLIRRQIVGHRSRLLQKNPHGIHHSQAQNVRRILVKGFHLRWELKYTTFSYRRLTYVWSIFIRLKRFNRILLKAWKNKEDQKLVRMLQNRFFLNCHRLW